MAMVNMKDLLSHAYNNRYAVGAFEVVNLDFLQAVVDAAEKSRSPVVLNIVEPHFDLYDHELLLAAVVRAAKRATVPIAVHMDHCSSVQTIQSAIRMGCNSVMIDAGAEAFPVNVERTREVVQLAHVCGIPVEGEIGYVNGMDADDDENNEHEPVYTQIEEAKAYIDKTGVDFLAVSIGTVHGRMKNKPRLDFARLARIHEKVKVPFVIHGGTGLSEQQYRKLIDYGVAKINYFTVLEEVNAKQIGKNIQAKNTSYQQIFSDVREQIAAEVQNCMQVINSAGRAAEVLMQCQPWNDLEHLVVYEPVRDDKSVFNEGINQCKRDLIKIPGILNVEKGRLVDKNNRNGHCWVMRMANEEVLKNYKHHPIYKAYVDKYFRPLESRTVAVDCEVFNEVEKLAVGAGR